MGWNKQCKQLRKKIFQDTKDRNTDREYDIKPMVTKQIKRHTFTFHTFSSKGLHRQYKAIKRLMRRKVNGYE